MSSNTQNSITIVVTSNYYNASYFRFEKDSSWDSTTYYSGWQQSQAGYYQYSYTFNGLQAGRSYYLKAYSYEYNGQIAPVESGGTYFSTQAAPLPPQGTPSVSADTAYSGGTHYINVYWSDVSGETGYYIYANDNYKAFANANETYKQISVDSEYTLYTIKVIPYNGSGNGNYGSTNVRSRDITAPIVNSYYATDIQKDYITMYASGSDSGSGMNGFDFYCYSSDGNTLINSATKYGSSAYCSFTGLAPDVSYVFKVRAFDNQLNYGSIGSNYSARTLKNRPYDFSWDNSKASGARFNVSSSEWNRFIGRINEFRIYKGLKGYGFTTAPYSDGKFYAFMFNQAVAAINEMNPPVHAPASQSSGGIIYASLLIDIVRSLNSVS
ncbi:hypothetical protein GK047_19685 [Paenibacillus sp. SYP-B3998]|uniref:Fibronectin type III domain-containing protein n=1 Tax=Paenibacillus sp. SYP-B3998 TaxID=2678564 RepID=A0A6G4A160_9BACL|nr:hypothetical protein [Paenibacillus sp. SYP-B3998]NEW08226.1 hypothetical protein [Paenibacillus sp. SYP-B3998]